MKSFKEFLVFCIVSLVLLKIVNSQEISSSASVTKANNVQRIFQESSEDPHEDHEHEHDHEDDEDEDHVMSDEEGVVDVKTWLFASLAILAISLCGIFGVIIIPVMQKVFYQHLLQFLIALAVGTLSGDALLHLLPHALLPDHHDQDQDHHVDNHSRAVWVGLVAAGAVIVFYFFEKIINIVQAWRSRRKTVQSKGSDDEESVKKKAPPPLVVREGHEVSDRAKGENVCIKKYSNYCVADLDSNMETPDRGWNSDSSQSSNNNQEHAKKHEQQKVIISQHEMQHHGHSHAHSHVHSAPQNIASVAWMVILGDGVHNLADGMAIGVAFASGTWSGVSTSVAVLCHELPHEIGDFAMLLKAGMSVKQAIFYNLLSSILSYIGMVTGLLLGQISDITPWIFAGTAGIFLYVALVDMVPELSSGHAHPLRSAEDVTGAGQCVGLVLQLLGMMTGVVIMLVIALSEDWMMELI